MPYSRHMGLLHLGCLRLKLRLLLPHLNHPRGVGHRRLWDTTREWLGGVCRLWSEGRGGGWWHTGASLTITHIASFHHGEFGLICRTLTFKRWH